MTAGPVPAFALRVPTPDDALAWSRLFDDEETMRYVTGGERQTLEQYRRVAAEQEAVHERYGVCRYALVVPAPVDATVVGTTPVGPAPVVPTPVAPGSPDTGGGEEVAGFVGVSPWPREWGPVGELEIGWRLGPAYRGRGLVTAAAIEVLRRARDAGVPDPVAIIQRDNAASRRVAERLGMSAVDTWHELGWVIDGWRLPTSAGDVGPSAQ